MESTPCRSLGMVKGVWWCMVCKHCRSCRRTITFSFSSFLASHLSFSGFEFHEWHSFIPLMSRFFSNQNSPLNASQMEKSNRHIWLIPSPLLSLFSCSFWLHTLLFFLLWSRAFQYSTSPLAPHFSAGKQKGHKLPLILSVCFCASSLFLFLLLRLWFWEKFPW